LGPDVNTLKHMVNISFDKGEDVYKFVSEKDRPVHVRFPVKLAVKIEEEFPEFFYYSDFILNLNKGEVFINYRFSDPQRISLNNAFLHTS
jgi:hypothetical protein